MRKKRLCRREKRWLAGLTSAWSLQAFADLPVPADPEAVGAGEHNYIAWVQAWIEEIGTHAASAVSVALFIWAAWILIAKFNEARSSSNPDWGGVALVAVIASALVAVSSYFLAESATVFGGA